MRSQFRVMWSYPEIDPVALQLGPLSIHWYGIMYLGAFAAAWSLAMLRVKKPYSPIAKEHVDDLIFYGAMGVVIGGRLGYVFFYNFDKFLSDPIWLFRVWEGGMSFHGGLLGVGAVLFWFSRRINQPITAVFDFAAPIVPIGLGLGRMGNFIGQELWGRPTEGSWGMVFPRDPDALARHPSQLYQFLLEGIVLFGIVYWFSNKPRPNLSVTGVFLIFYGLFRFLVEFVREPDDHIGFDMFGWLTRGQMLSIPMVVAGLAMVIWAYRVHQLPKNQSQL